MTSLMQGDLTRCLGRLCLIAATLLVAGCESGSGKKQKDAVWDRLAELQAQVDGAPIDYNGSIDEPMWASSGTVQAGQTFNATVGLESPVPPGGQTYIITYAVDEVNPPPPDEEQVLLPPILYSRFVPQGANQFTIPMNTKAPVPAPRHLRYWVRSQLGGDTVHGVVTINP